jgi:hypothetical protein
MAFLFASFVPALATSLLPDNYGFAIFRQMVLLLLMGICFSPFTMIVLYLRKLE